MESEVENILLALKKLRRKLVIKAASVSSIVYMLLYYLRVSVSYSVLPQG